MAPMSELNGRCSEYRNGGRSDGARRLAAWRRQTASCLRQLATAAWPPAGRRSGQKLQCAACRRESGLPLLTNQLNPVRLIGLHQAYGRRLTSRSILAGCSAAALEVIVRDNLGRALAPSTADADPDMGIRLDVPDIARPAPVLGDDPEGAVVEAVGNRVASRPHGLAAGRFQNRSSRRRKPKSKQPADDGIDHILRRSAGKPPLRVTTTRHGFHPNAPDRSLWSRGVGPKTSVPWTALAGFGCAPRPQGPGEREAPDRDHDQVQERRAAMAPGAPSRPPARPPGTRAGGNRLYFAVRTVIGPVSQPPLHAARHALSPERPSR